MICLAVGMKMELHQMEKLPEASPDNFSKSRGWALFFSLTPSFSRPFQPIHHGLCPRSNLHDLAQSAREVLIRVGHHTGVGITLKTEIEDIRGNYFQESLMD